MDFPIFAARGTIARMARQALEDLAALNLLRDFIWIDVDGLSSTDSKVTVVRRGQRPQQMRLEQAVGARGGAGMQLHAINVIGDVDHGGQLNRAQINNVTEKLRAVNASFAGTGNNLMFTSVNADIDGDTLPTFDGYRNLLVAPEDAKSPDSGATIFNVNDESNDGPPFSLWLATSAASLAGLWVGFDEAPTARLEPNPTTRLVRCYMHHVSGEDFQHQLQNAIFDLSTTPLPTVMDNRTQVNVTRDNQRQLAQRAAEEFVHTHARNHLVKKAQDTMVPSGTETTVEKAVSNAFAQWAKNLFTHPATFFQELGGEARASANAAVQAKIYGYDSNVTVGKVQVAPDTQEPRIELSSEDRVQVASDLKELWQHYAGTATALVDAQRYNITGQEEAVRPAVMKDSRGQLTIVQTPSDSIPGPSDKFGAGESQKVRQLLGQGPVAPYDALRIHRVKQDLDRLSTNQEFMSAKTKFEGWRHAHEHSFASHVANGLIGLHNEQAQLRQAKIEELRRLLAEEEQAESMSPWHGILRWLGWVAFWSLAVVLTAWWIGNTGQNAPRWGWIENLNAASGKTKGWMLSLWFALWLLCYMFQVLIETLHNIRIQERRMARTQRINTVRRNILQAEASLRYIDVAYQQFLSVSDLYGALFEKPFGDITGIEAQTLQPTNALPEAITVDELEVSEADVEQIANDYRRQFFQEGWMSNQVASAIDQAAVELGNDPQAALKVEPATLLGHTGGSDGGPLARLASYTASEQFLSRDRSQSTWSRVVERLKQDESMTNRLNPAPRLQSPGYFRQDILTPLGVNRNLHDVVEDTAVYAKPVEGNDLSRSSIVLHAGNPGATREDVKLAGSPAATLHVPEQETSSGASEALGLFEEGF